MKPNRVLLIKKHLQKHGRIHPDTAQKNYGICYSSLGYIIHRLRTVYNMNLVLDREERVDGVWSDYILKS